jgi:hypothetical protein
MCNSENRWQIHPLVWHMIISHMGTCTLAIIFYSTLCTVVVENSVSTTATDIFSLDDVLWQQILHQCHQISVTGWQI